MLDLCPFPMNKIGAGVACVATTYGRPEDPQQDPSEKMVSQQERHCAKVGSVGEDNAAQRPISLFIL